VFPPDEITADGLFAKWMEEPEIADDADITP
jgi:hypothetical protein